VPVSAELLLTLYAVRDELENVAGLTQTLWRYLARVDEILAVWPMNPPTPLIDFVLGQYAKEGVGELDGDKLAPLLKLRYKNAISDAAADLGDPGQIRGLFIGFQRYLYEASARPAAS
jgi:hypothetical protein